MSETKYTMTKVCFSICYSIAYLKLSFCKYTNIFQWQNNINNREESPKVPMTTKVLKQLNSLKTTLL